MKTVEFKFDIDQKVRVEKLGIVGTDEAMHRGNLKS
jgi:hypothetical protein